MVELTVNEYDNGEAGQDSNLTTVTQHIDNLTDHDRTSTFNYDYRNRRLTAFSGTVGIDASFGKTYYDNLDRVVKSEHYATDSPGSPGDGNLLARSETLRRPQSRL